jgi:DNA polymerase-3 subunit gamma/tau
MSYTVLARKYRSKTFDEVIGQDSITTTLRNAISQGRVHHGYLFCGTRGVGKTSMARILAKALNCLAADGPTVTPCGSCDSCVAVARGDDVDVVEIDAASNTGVDNIRELRSNAIYRPARSRFKVYIIDEVHMLSTGAFNALLKTLEEPPGHVKFIFATTEAQKVPATILSRVQRFDFRSIVAGDIAKQLAMICREEAVEAEEAALKRLARLANGSMRDALSLLDQVWSMSGKQITADIVNELFPAAHDELFAELIDRLAASDAAGALEVVDRSLGQGHALDYWCTLLIGQIRDLMLLRVCGAETDLIDVPAGSRAKLAEQSQQFDAGAFVYMISVLEELRRSVKSSGSGRPLVEAAVVRLAEASKFSSIESLLERVGEGGSAPGSADTAKASSAVGASPRSRSKKNTAPAVAAPGEQRATTTPHPDRSLTVAAPIMDERAVDGAREGGSAAPAPANAAAQAEAVPAGRRMTQADLKTAHAEPVVKAALELFSGQVVHVQRDATAKTAPARPPEAPSAEP